jgi:hypothetical protein
MRFFFGKTSNLTIERFGSIFLVERLNSLFILIIEIQKQGNSLAYDAQISHFLLFILKKTQFV